MGGDHCLLLGGNGRLIHALAENVPISFEKTVHTIRYGRDRVTLSKTQSSYGNNNATLFNSPKPNLLIVSSFR